MSLKKCFRAVAAVIATFISGSLLFGGTVALADGVHMAEPGQLGFMAPATAVMRSIIALHDWLLIMCIGVSAFVLIIMVYIMIRFNEKANPEPSKVTHHTGLEIIWTTVPILILLFIAVPSFKLLYFEDVIPEADLTVKAVGNQWYWTYEYPDHGDFSFDSVLMTDEEAAKAGLPRLLATDNRVVVPVGKTVRVIVTANDVIHAWAIPAFGVKIDAVPGKLNETWFKAEKEGIYYGQCSELCGKDHGFMPIMVEVVSQARYDNWVLDAQEKYAGNEIENTTRLATVLPGESVMEGSF